jgi:hypothetical protein
MPERNSPLVAKMIAEGLEPVKVPGSPGDLRQRLHADGLIPASELSGSWRRGMMHAVERLDLVLRRKLAPRAQLEAIRAELDAIQHFAQTHWPATYQEAFRLSEDELQRVIQTQEKAA